MQKRRRMIMQRGCWVMWRQLILGDIRGWKGDADGDGAWVDQVLHLVFEGPTSIGIMSWGVHVMGATDTLIMVLR